MTDNSYVKKTTTPDAVSPDELKDLQKTAKKKEEDDKTSEVMTRGHELVNIVCEADEYNEFEDIQALAAQAVYNLKRKYEQFSMSELEDINNGEGNPRHLMKGVNLAARIDEAFRIILDNLQ